MSVEPTPVSDNFCIFFSIYFHVSKSSDPITYSYLRIDNAAKSRMVRALPDILSSCCALTSLDDQTDSFNSALTAVLNSAAPLKTRRQTQTKAAPWFNDETHKLVNSSKSTTCSLDPIPTNLFKELLPTLLSSGLHILNESLLTGSVPSAFKKAIVMPLLKKATLDTHSFRTTDQFQIYHSCLKY